MLYGQTARAYILTEAGRTGEAMAALGAAAALAPRSPEVEMARAYIARATGQTAASLAADEAFTARGRAGADGPATDDADAVTEAALGAAQPNPVSRSAVIPLALPAASEVRLALYDVLGREALVLVDGPLDAGRHRVALDTGALAPGVYLIRAVVTAASDAHVLTGRVTVQR